MVALITFILLYGFGLLGYLFFVHYSVEEQITFIAVHLVSSLIMFFIWLLDRRYRSVFKENKRLKAMLAELEGFKNKSPAKVLSYTHFMSFVDYIIAATKRKGVKNHLLTVTVKEDVPNFSSVEHVLLQSAIKTFRNNFFDLITQRTKGEVLVFLQDTDEPGANIAVERLNKELLAKIAIKDLPFTFNLSQITDKEDLYAE